MHPEYPATLSHSHGSFAFTVPWHRDVLRLCHLRLQLLRSTPPSLRLPKSIASYGQGEQDEAGTESGGIMSLADVFRWLSRLRIRRIDPAKLDVCGRALFGRGLGGTCVLLSFEVDDRWFRARRRWCRGRRWCGCRRRW